MPDSKNRYNWNKLTKLQLGKYAEYLTKMEFLLLGCDVFCSEVDQHGIDFVVRASQGCHFDVQVKSFQSKPGTTPYIYMEKGIFKPDPSLLLAVVQFVQGEPSKLFLLQSGDGSSHHPLFESRDYVGKKSPPEWGLTLSKKKMALLNAECLFESTVTRLFGV